MLISVFFWYEKDPDLLDRIRRTDIFVHLLTICDDRPIAGERCGAGDGERRERVVRRERQQTQHRRIQH